MPTGRFTRSASVLAAALLMTGMAAAPALAASGPNLKVSVVAQQGHWLLGEYVGLDVTVSNIGDSVVSGAFGTAFSESGTAFWVDQHQWGDLDDSGSGATIAQGETWPGPGCASSASARRSRCTPPPTRPATSPTTASR
jgi:hypothetical protein